MSSPSSSDCSVATKKGRPPKTSSYFSTTQTRGRPRKKKLVKTSPYFPLTTRKRGRPRKNKSPTGHRNRSLSPVQSNSSRSPSPVLSRAAIPNPYLKKINDQELRYDYGPHSLTIKLKNGKFTTNKMPSKACRLLTSHCSRPHETNRDKKPRNTKITLTQI